MCLRLPHKEMPELQSSVQLARGGGGLPALRCTAPSHLCPLVICTRAEARSQSVPLFDLSWEHMHQVTQIFTTLCMPMNDYKCED